MGPGGNGVKNPLTLEEDDERLYLTKILFEEPVDEGLLKEMLQAPKTLQEISVEAKESKGKGSQSAHASGASDELIHKLTKLSKEVQGGAIPVSYDFADKGAARWGRVYPVGSLSAGELPGTARSHLLGKTWIALDFSNCHLAILCNDMKKAGVSLTYLEEYCQDRETWLERVQSHYKVERNAAKNLFIRLLFGGHFETWRRDCGIDCHMPALSNIAGFVADLERACGLILDANPKMRAELKPNARAIQKAKRPVGRPPAKLQRTEGGDQVYASAAQVASYYFQERERRLLRHFFDILKREGLVVENPATHRFQAMLRYDGIDVLLERYKASDPKLLKRVEEYIFKKSGTRINVVEKPYDRCIKLAEKFQREASMKDLPYEVKVRLDLEHLKRLTYYDAQKKYWECFFSKLTFNSSIAWVQFRHSVSGGDPVHTVVTRSERELVDAFKHVKTDRGEVDLKNGKPVPKSFIREWLVDGDLSVHENLCFSPFSEKEPTPKVTKHSFNIFRGYAASHIPDSEGTTYEAAAALNLFHFVGLHQCECDPQKYQFMWNCLAHLVQRPRQRVNISPVFQNKPQGSGCDVFFAAIGRVLGEVYYKNSSKMRDFFGDFAEGFVNKLLVVINETEVRDTKDYQSQIKHMITCSETTVNPKHERPFPVAVYAFIVFISNRQTAVHFDNNDNERRFAAFRPGDGLTRWSASTWKAIAEDAFKGRGFLRALYRDLLDTNLDGFDAKEQRDITLSSSYFESSANNAALTVKFFVHLILRIADDTPVSESDERSQRDRISSHQSPPHQPWYRSNNEEYQMTGCSGPRPQRTPWEPAGLDVLDGVCKVKTKVMREQYAAFASSLCTRRDNGPSIGHIGEAEFDKYFPGYIVMKKARGERYFQFEPRKLWALMVKKRWVREYSEKYHHHVMQTKAAGGFSVDKRFTALSNTTVEAMERKARIAFPKYANDGPFGTCIDADSG